MWITLIKWPLCESGMKVPRTMNHQTEINILKSVARRRNLSTTPDYSFKIGLNTVSGVFSGVKLTVKLSTKSVAIGSKWYVLTPAQFSKLLN